jgi:hypothetical protein
VLHTGHCKRLAPTWGELAEAVKENPTIKIAHVDCTVDRDVCTNAEVSLSTVQALIPSRPRAGPRISPRGEGACL